MHWLACTGPHPLALTLPTPDITHGGPPLDIFKTFKFVQLGLHCIVTLLTPPPPTNMLKLVNAHKHSLRRLCFYMCLSVILFTGGGSASVHAGMPPPGADPPEKNPPAADPPQQTPPPGADPPGVDTPPSRHPPTPRADTPQQSMLRDTVNVWAVRILLECNLVHNVALLSARERLTFN